jgi:polyphosphate kinase 2 (PPK2 family)
LWRFWNRINEAEKITIFDRTGMVVCWSSVLKDLLHLSNGNGHMTKSIALKDLFDSQTIVVKIWLAISKDEQEQRFKARERHRTNVLKLLPKIGVTVISG